MLNADGRYSARHAPCSGARYPRSHGLVAAGAPLMAGEFDVERNEYRLRRRLDQSVLPIQGPPGTGKTYTGAQIAVALMAQGRRVGVTAPSHKAIHNLLDEIEHVARDRERPL